jgi:alpha-tubulin suppressor-like RCC1 family protein
MYGFGSNSKGQLGIGQTPQELYASPQRINFQSLAKDVTTYPTAIACGHLFSAMILDGGVFMWGSNEKGQCGNGSVTPSCVWLPSSVSFNENVYVMSISCGLDHTLAVTGMRVYH